jgi:hypothetical protein
MAYYSPDEGQRLGRNSDLRKRKQNETGKSLKIKTIGHNSHSSIVTIGEETGRYITQSGVQRSWENLVERPERVLITWERMCKEISLEEVK